MGRSSTMDMVEAIDRSRRVSEVEHHLSQTHACLLRRMRDLRRQHAAHVWAQWSGCLTMIAAVCWANEYADTCLWRGRFESHPGWASEGLWVDGEGMNLIVRPWRD